MVQRGGTLASFSITERTRPVTVAPPDFAVAGRPLNWAIRKRRTSFWPAVSNVNMGISYAEESVSSHDYSFVNIANGISTARKHGRSRPQSLSRLLASLRSATAAVQL